MEWLLDQVDGAFDAGWKECRELAAITSEELSNLGSQSQSPQQARTEMQLRISEAIRALKRKKGTP